MSSRFISACTITTVGLACKAFLKFGCSSVTVNGLHHLLHALADEERSNGRGVVTDDPMTWGVLPLSSYWKLRNMRWALGASDIMFTNPVFSEFFRRGQVLETFRGKGIYQKAVDSAIELLNEGNWVHLFGEGKVNQPHQYPQSADGTKYLPRFKWGTARIIMETQRLPVIIPMWLSGFEKLMPEPRGFPRFLPRIRKPISIAFGEPINADHFTEILNPWRARALESTNTSTTATDTVVGGTGGSDALPLGNESEWKRKVRVDLTEIIQREVEKVGYSVSGPMLGKSPLS